VNLLKHTALRLLLVFTILFTTVSISKIYAQKIFTVKISIPENLNGSKVEIKYDNGLRLVNVKPTFKEGSLIISDSFFARYATLTILYPDTENHSFANHFFITGKIAYIKFLPKTTDTIIKNPLENYTSNNVVEVRKSNEAKKLALYLQNEESKIDELFEKYGASVFENDSINKMYLKLENSLVNKKFQYIISNTRSYFSFWSFRTEIELFLAYFPADSLLNIYKNSFPKYFQSSLEGREIIKLLVGRAFVKTNFLAPRFTVIDLMNREISLNNYKGKYLLLNFWASWCLPCIEEMPMLRELYKKLPKEQFEILSVSYDSDRSKCIEAIKKYGMDWTNVFGDHDIIKKYGNKPIPGLYLIDPTGKIVYSNFEATTPLVDYLRNKIK
jgi:thiol-disulfide isomerase/thioredoxin